MLCIAKLQAQLNEKGDPFLYDKTKRITGRGPKYPWMGRTSNVYKL